MRTAWTINSTWSSWCWRQRRITWRKGWWRRKRRKWRTAWTSWRIRTARRSIWRCRSSWRCRITIWTSWCSRRRRIRRRRTTTSSIWGRTIWRAIWIIISCWWTSRRTSGRTRWWIGSRRRTICTCSLSIKSISTIAITNISTAITRRSWNLYRRINWISTNRN